jgi:hypothetical protein
VLLELADFGQYWREPSENAAALSSEKRFATRA